MGNSKSKRSNSTKSKTSKKSQKLEYKRHFSSDNARQSQSKNVNEYKKVKSQVTTLPELKEEKDNNNNLNNNDIKNKNEQVIKKNDNEEEKQANNNSKSDAQSDLNKIAHTRTLSPGINLVIDEIEEIKNNNNNINNNSEDSPYCINSPRLTSRSSNLSNMNIDILWGYCELTRKRLDEDQASTLTWDHSVDGFIYTWAIFDGHGGYETALYCAENFLNYLKDEHIINNEKGIKDWNNFIDNIFVNFDNKLGKLNIKGGTTVILLLYISNKYTLICSNAGDARACHSINNGKSIQTSYDHSPMNDYERIVSIARLPEQQKLISKSFRINPKNETLLEISNLSNIERRKTPIIIKEFDKSRLLATIGVARGFGDFNLSVFTYRNIRIKPYLSPKPYINIINLKQLKPKIGKTDVLVMACDGIFDVLTNQQVIDNIRKNIWDNNNKNKQLNYKLLDNACQILGNLAYKKGTQDDVTVFVIPLFNLIHTCNINTTTINNNN